MFAHKIVDFTGPDDVRWGEADEPAAGGGVLIDVAAAGVSFADLLQTRGAYQMKVPLPYTPGMDAAGVVRSAPPGTGLAAGQRVAVLLDYGCWQEVVSVPAPRVLPLPGGMSFEAGAAAPLNYLTALFALARRAQAQPGDTLLVHGAAGGVGTAAIQLGRALGLRTVAVVSDEAKKEFALRCGAHHAVLSDGWLAAVRDLTGERAVDIVLDPGRRGPDDRQPPLAGTGRPARGRGIYRRRDPCRQGEPASAGQHRRAGSGLPGVFRAAAGHGGRPVGPAGQAATSRNAA